MKRSILLCSLVLLTVSLFSQVDSSNEIYPFVSRINGKVGYVNRQNKIIVEPQYASGTAEYEKKKTGLHTVSMDRKIHGIINSAGKLLIDFTNGYEWISPVTSNFLLVQKDKKYGFVDTNNIFIAPLIYDFATSSVHWGLVEVGKDDRYGLMNLKGEMLIPMIYESIGSFTDENSEETEYTYVKLNGKCGYINIKGELKIDYLYDRCHVSKKILPVQLNGKWGAINYTGKLLIPFNYDEIYVRGSAVEGSNKDSIRSAVFDLDGKFLRTKIERARQSNVPGADRIFVKVEMEGSFPGGNKAWDVYLQKELDQKVPSRNKAPKGVYKVTVVFVIGKDGVISDIETRTFPGYGMEEEAVRVIEKSGNWLPATNNGRVVNSYFYQPIIFTVE